MRSSIFEEQASKCPHVVTITFMAKVAEIKVDVAPSHTRSAGSAIEAPNHAGLQRGRALKRKPQSVRSEINSALVD